MAAETAPERHPPSWKQGFGDGLSQAVGMVVTPTFFVLLGVFLDGRFGTRPVLAIVLGVLSTAGVFASTYYEYKAKMDQAEEVKPWARSR